MTIEDCKDKSFNRSFKASVLFYFLKKENYYKFIFVMQCRPRFSISTYYQPRANKCSTHDYGRRP